MNDVGGRFPDKRCKPERQRRVEPLFFAEQEDFTAGFFDFFDEASAGREHQDAMPERRTLSAAEHCADNMLCSAVVQGIYYMCYLVTHYWSILHWKGRKIPDYSTCFMIKN